MLSVRGGTGVTWLGHKEARSVPKNVGQNGRYKTGPTRVNWVL